MLSIARSRRGRWNSREKQQDCTRLGAVRSSGGRARAARVRMWALVKRLRATAHEDQKLALLFVAGETPQLEVENCHSCQQHSGVAGAVRYLARVQIFV